MINANTKGKGEGREGKERKGKEGKERKGREGKGRKGRDGKGDKGIQRQKRAIIIATSTDLRRRWGQLI